MPGNLLPRNPPRQAPTRPPHHLGKRGGRGGQHRAGSLPCGHHGNSEHRGPGRIPRHLLRDLDMPSKTKRALEHGVCPDCRAAQEVIVSHLDRTEKRCKGRHLSSRSANLSRRHDPGRTPVTSRVGYRNPFATRVRVHADRGTAPQRPPESLHTRPCCGWMPRGMSRPRWRITGHVVIDGMRLSSPIRMKPITPVRFD
mgnify:FL=1